MPGDGPFDELAQGSRYDMAIAHAQFLAHVDAMDDRQRHVADALGHRDQGEVSSFRAVIRLHRGRRTAEQQDGLMEPGYLFRHDAGVIARRFILLVAHILFLIEDDEPNIIGRRKECRTRADDDARLPTAHADDGVVAFREAQAAVHDDKVIGEIRLERQYDLSRQGDFRHEYDDTAPRGTHAPSHLDVDLGLAAARDALEQETVILLLHQEWHHRTECPFLIIREFDMAPLATGLAIAVAKYAVLADGDEARLLQMPDGLR